MRDKGIKAGRMKIRSAAVPLLVIVLWVAAAFSQTSYSRAEAGKVFEAIGHIQSAVKPPPDGKLRRIMIAETEFNAYIAYRIEHEKSKVLEKLELKFFAGDKLEGRFLINLSGQDLPKILNSVMDIYFTAVLEAKNGRARLNMKKIMINGQPVQTMVIDLVLAIASRLEPLEISSMSDWYELPYGIEDIRVHNGRAAFFY